MRKNEFVSKLTEIKMMPSYLKQEVTKINAKVGMEFEMCVPKPDAFYDYASNVPETEESLYEKPDSMEAVIHFFKEYSDASPNQLQNLKYNLIDELYEWAAKEINVYWRDPVLRADYINDYLLDNNIERHVPDGESAYRVSNELSKIIANFEYTDIPDDLPDIFYDMFSENDTVQDIFNKVKENSIPHIVELNQADFFSEMYPTMQDIANEYDIHIQSMDLEYDIDAARVYAIENTIGYSFSKALGTDVVVSPEYHHAVNKDPTVYTIEPDGSIDVDDDETDLGLEFVSPVMDVEDMTSDLNKVIDWAHRHDCYTNKSTGLHMNVSIADVSMSSLDHVKLILLLGDQHILREYKREISTYARQTFANLKNQISIKPQLGYDALDQLKINIDNAAKSILPKSLEKYMSIHFKPEWIEFRAPGGDWLNEDIEKLIATLNRFVVVLEAAFNPQAYRKEYLTKLYKFLISSINNVDERETIPLFISYVDGELTVDQLKRLVTRSQTARTITKQPLVQTTKLWYVNDDKHEPVYLSAASVEDVTEIIQILTKHSHAFNLKSVNFSPIHTDSQTAAMTYCFIDLQHKQDRTCVNANSLIAALEAMARKSGLHIFKLVRKEPLSTKSAVWRVVSQTGDYTDMPANTPTDAIRRARDSYFTDADTLNAYRLK